MRTKWKIVENLHFLTELVSYHKSLGRKVVVTNGCVDIMHIGHVHCLESARSNGDVLIVGINSDRSTRAIKGDKRPIIPEQQRMEMVASLLCVDHVILFDENTPYVLIYAIQPDILVKGGDWEKEEIIGSDIVKGNGGKVVCINFEVEMSSSSVIKTIIERYKE
mgnify:CR=1 FL=1